MQEEGRASLVVVGVGSPGTAGWARVGGARGYRGSLERLLGGALAKAAHSRNKSSVLSVVLGGPFARGS